MNSEITPIRHIKYAEFMSKYKALDILYIVICILWSRLYSDSVSQMQPFEFCVIYIYIKLYAQEIHL